MAKKLIAIILCLSFVAPAFSAGPAQPPAGASPTKAAKPAKPPWAELTPAQQEILAPLKDDWTEIDTSGRGKWVRVADRYPKMKPPEQQRLQTRMKEWAALTPEQRRIAREKYQTIKKLPPESRARVQSQWHQYQQSIAQPEAGSAEASGPGAATQ